MFSSATPNTKLHQTPQKTLASTRSRRASRASIAAPVVELSDSELSLESDDSGSEFDPNEHNHANFPDDLDENDEEVMLEAAVEQSLRTAREDQERAAGLTSAGTGSSKSKSRAPTSNAAALRAAAAERRLATQQGKINPSEESEMELLSDIDGKESEEEPLSKGKGKQVAKAKGAARAKVMTFQELKKLSKEERKMQRLRRRGMKKEEAELCMKLGRKLTHVSRNLSLSRIRH